jgi:hypothetical protein
MGPSVAGLELRLKHVSRWSGEAGACAADGTARRRHGRRTVFEAFRFSVGAFDGRFVCLGPCFSFLNFLHGCYSLMVESLVW